MKTKEEFQKRFNNGEFDKLVESVKSPEDFVKKINELGYDVTWDDIMSDELSDDAVSSVAGGKGDTINIYQNCGNTDNSNNTNMGDGNTVNQR